MSIGAELRQAREELGLSLEEVGEKTKIRKKYIVAMENDDFGVLPGGAYVRGFLRNYARLLMLDEEALIGQYEMQYQSRDEIEPAAATTEAGPKVKNATTNWRPLAALGVLLVVLGVIYWAGVLAHNPQNDMADTPKGQMTVDNHQGTNGDGQDQGARAPADKGNKDNSIAPDQQNMNVVLQVTNKVCWMRILVDEQNAFEGNVGPGMTKTFKGNESIIVWLGDAGAVKVMVNGEDYGYLGGPGQVVKRTFASNSEPSDG